MSKKFLVSCNGLPKRPRLPLIPKKKKKAYVSCQCLREELKRTVVLPYQTITRGFFFKNHPSENKRSWQKRISYHGNCKLKAGVRNPVLGWTGVAWFGDLFVFHTPIISSHTSLLLLRYSLDHELVCDKSSGWPNKANISVPRNSIYWSTALFIRYIQMRQHWPYLVIQIVHCAKSSYGLSTQRL